MRLTPEEVAAIAQLAHLEFDERELEEFVPQFLEILDHVGQLDRLTTAGIEPRYHVLDERDRGESTREDSVAPSLPRDDALANGPEIVDGQFRVPKVID